jgi:hypothetical protein
MRPSQRIRDRWQARVARRALAVQQTRVTELRSDPLQPCPLVVLPFVLLQARQRVQPPVLRK